MLTLPAPRAFKWTLAALYATLFALLYVGANALSAGVPWRVPVALPWEPVLPFHPAWALPYLSLPLLLLALPLKLKPTGLWVVFAALMVQTGVAALCFVLLPVRVDFPPRVADGVWHLPFMLADTLNLTRNHLPSLHVALACTAAWALAPHAAPAMRWLPWAWAAAIALSTVGLHEHHLLDVAAGVLLAAGAVRWVGRWAVQPRVLAAVRLEWLLARNQWLFARRHLRYGWIALLLGVQRLRHPRQGRLLVLGFCLLQAADDLLDGDRPSPHEDPLHLADALNTALRSHRFAPTGQPVHDELMHLAEPFATALRAQAGDTAVAQTADLIAVMRRDRERALQAAAWPAARLAAHHRATFTHSLDLLLAASGSCLRARDVPELLHALAWCSTARDLREDWAAGIVNVPAEVLHAAHLTAPWPPMDTVLTAPAVRQWLHTERQQAMQQLDQLAQRALPHADRVGERIVRLFARSVRGFAGRRFARLYPGV
ncbi:MAG: phosphatase PAP2 family protein [Pseudomonadota bacterium]|nr:phosphatase PAP2 family protein [Pseudomonadota bacterium]